MRDLDLSSLTLITYGTEPMSLATLKALNQALPGVRCKQTYGLTEVGILPTRSEDASSTWMKVGGQHHEAVAAALVEILLHLVGEGVVDRLGTLGIG